MSLPAADELFRTTGGSAVQPSAPQQGQGKGQLNGEAPAKVPAPASEPEPDPEGRQEHTAAYEGGEAGEGETHSGGGEHGGRDARSATRQEERGTSPSPASGPASPSPASQQAGAAGAGRGNANANANAKGRQPSGSSSRRSRAANRRPSGRERHDEKITVYVSAEELMDLEHARLVLRGEHGLAVDRGRIVREAVAVVLADLESRGDASILVRRLRGR
ncbi:hypothetical protein [Streptomyces iconiensis]|uniref:Uncharacterized protein n=1 Tax=Streptomyces iconiensis TaxID=1384038 RepID=A0ABT7A5X5_9ACTN|nr:hypothetical protein [Streptomyces iconiensis]MDJ1136743.1 hypothetical protein [Streptomyces iconiensis]